MLDLPCITFFALVEEAQRQKTINYSELLEISAVSICDTRWYKYLREKYDTALSGGEKKSKQLPPKPTPAVDLGTPEGQSLMRGMALIAKRDAGYH